VKTTWHIPKPMASLSRSLAPPTPKPSRPVTPVDDEPGGPTRPTTTAPPPMRRHAQGILGVLAARLPLFVWSTDSALRVTSSLGERPANLPLPEVQGPKPELRLSDRLLPAEAEHPALTAHRTALRGEAVEFDVPGDGQTFEVHIEPLRDTAGAIEGTVGVAFDVTDRRRAGTRLVHAVLHDPLTGLPNRTLFLERLRQALGRARQRGTSRVAVLLLDLDGFRAVNHQLGLDAGDRLLVDVARRIEERLRAADTLARLEGDTFAVLLQDVEQQADALRVARRIRENLGRPFVVAGFPRPATAGVGIAVSEGARARMEDLLHDAEAALRRARAAGGGGEHVFDPLTDIEPAPSWPRLGPPAPADGGDRPPAPEAVLRWRPATGQGTSRLRRLARAAGLVLPSRF
jgi:diguanylate cyclase (GGDEF)-like protein